MDHHPLYGPSVPEKGWVPAPSFILRRDRILRLVRGFKPGRLLEVGCGAGTLVYELSRLGFACEALETSAAARAIAYHVNHGDIPVHESPQSWLQELDYLFAFEVLEHVENDRDALATWRSWLRPGATLLLSVPAHKRKWTTSDIWAGHYRRYERAELFQLVSATGFAIEHFESYGFPLANMLSPLRTAVDRTALRSRRRPGICDMSSDTDRSGVDRAAASRFFPFLESLPGRLVMQFAFRLQDWSTSKDWGTGYLLLARRR
jgi:SAM-dependent methyltransferase